jgi:hypothetical protein
VIPAVALALCPLFLPVFLLAQGPSSSRYQANGGGHTPHPAAMAGRKGTRQAGQGSRRRRACDQGPGAKVLPGVRGWYKIRRRDTTEGIGGAITGTSHRPQAVLLGRYGGIRCSSGSGRTRHPATWRPSVRARCRLPGDRSRSVGRARGGRGIGGPTGRAQDLGLRPVAAGESLAARTEADLVRPAAEQKRGGCPVRRGVDALWHLVHASECTSGVPPGQVEIGHVAHATSMPRAVSGRQWGHAGTWWRSASSA